MRSRALRKSDAKYERALGVWMEKCCHH